MSNPRPRPSNTASRWSSPLGWAAGASTLLHALVLAAIVLRLGATVPAEPPAEPSIELRLIETQGAGPATKAAPPAPASQPAPIPPEAPPAPADPVAMPLPLPPPAPPHPARVTPPTPPTAAPARPPEINLGGGEGLTNALASGRAILPARVDGHWRNHAPVYPVAAAERGEHGTVTLLIHVGGDGVVTGIDVAETSGFLLLDRAAREAVRTWRFLPAVRDGHPIGSDMPLRVTFELN